MECFDRDSPLEKLLVADLALLLEHFDKISTKSAKEIKNKWESLLAGNIEKKRFLQWPGAGTTSTGGWTTTHWHQGEPFNNFCPIKLRNGSRSVTGCPATAMAQILFYHQTINQTRFSNEDRYHHYYTQSFWIDDDFETYQFLSFDSLNTYLNLIEQKFVSNQTLNNNEMAALSLAAGFACKSVYVPQGSGTFEVSQAYDAFIRFGFTQATLLDAQYSDDIIRIKMIDNIKNALPIHLAVVDPAWSSGHNVVCDGYNDNGFFRINMGWGGSGDSWYNLPKGFPYSLTVFEGIVADIRKPVETPFQLVLSINCDTTGALVYGAGNYPDLYNVEIYASPVQGREFIGWTGSDSDLALVADPISAQTSVVIEGHSVSLTANYSGPKFDITFIVTGHNQSVVPNATILLPESSQNAVTNQDGYATISLTNGEYSYVVNAEDYQTFSGTFIVDNNPAYVVVNMQLTGIFENDTDEINILNPFNDFIVLNNCQRIDEVVIFSLLGKEILNEKNSSQKDLILNTNKLAAGVYVVCLKSKSGIHFSRIVIINR